MGLHSMHNTILLVDASARIASLLRPCLEQQGFRLLCAPNSEAALCTADEHPVDVLLMTADPSDLSDHELLAPFRGSPYTANLPVILIADHAEDANRLYSLENGAIDYLVGPVDPPAVLARIRSGLRIRHLERKLAFHEAIMYQLHEFALRLNTLESIDDTLQETLAVAQSVTSSSRSAILLPDAEDQRLRVAQHIGADASLAATLSIPIGEPIAGVVFEEQHACVVNTIEELPADNPVDLPLLGTPPFALAPICTDAGPVGVLMVADKRIRHAYSDQDLKALYSIASSAAVAIESQRRRHHLDQTRDAALLGLASLAEWRDAETGRHLERMREYALIIARKLQETSQYSSTITRGFLDALSRSMPLHDIGKVGIPDHILLKPGKLTEGEYDIMKTHAKIGADVLQAMANRIRGDSFLDMARDIARHHHERYDGKGYPARLTEQAIPLAARIAAVADVYDALSANRVYRTAWPHEQVVEYLLANRGSHFDPLVTDAFLEQASEVNRIRQQMSDAPTQESEQEEVVLGRA